MSLPSAKKRKIFDGRYEVISIVGRGLDSVVYHARHLSGAQQEVALKVLVNNKPKNSMTERLRKEALTLVSCRHKYVVRLDDFHSVAELCYLSMEYAALGDLRKYITARGAPLSPELGAEFLRQALEAMEFIHATGVLHRDVKPDNILVITENEIRLADFGLALLPGDELDLEELQNGVGSLSYLPPEMLKGQFYDSRSDLYSLGVCFYEAMAGFHPFENAPLIEQESARLDRNIKPLHEVNPLIPPHVSAVVASLMRHSVDHRFQTAMEALRALADTAFDGTSSATTEFSELDDEDPLTPTDDVATRTSVTSTTPTYTPVNVDEPIDSYTDDFDDFFKDTEYSSAAKPGISGNESPEPKPEDTQEMSAQRVQQLIEQDSKKRATAALRNSFGETPTAAAHVDSAPSWSVDTKPAHTPQANVSDDEALPGITIKSQGLILALLTMHPIIRTLLVGGVAALITIGLVVAPHVKPTEILASVTSSIESTENLPEDTEAITGDTLFPNLPAGTFAGTVYGILPGVTSPLALISRPEHNEITVVIGVEGWTPTTVSTKLGENSSSTIVVRSNSVLLNMTGSGSPSEVEGTFTNAITGETGVWSVKKLS